MAVLRLQFDIDGEVHPELHQELRSIADSQAQAERLRQLAAMGLVWERLRLQAYGRIEVPDLGSEPASAPEGSAPLPEQAVAPAAQVDVPQVDADTVQSADLADFVDLSDAVVLAHLAVPAAGPTDDHPSEHLQCNDDVVNVESPGGAAQTAASTLLPGSGVPEPLPLHEIRSAVRELPVLTEIVAAAELPNTNDIAAANEPRPAAAHAGGTLSTGAQVHELAPVRKTATRSRLMRMKEMGLFKNE